VLGQSLSPVQLTGFAITIGAIAYGATLQPTSLATHGCEARSRKFAVRRTVPLGRT